MARNKEVKFSTPRFYEMDGALRAYANRSIVVATIMGMVALIAVAGFLFVRLQPPTVIRVASDGEASVLTPNHLKTRLMPTVLAASNPSAAPDSLEKEAFVKNFLTRYLNYNPHTLSQNWAEAMIHLGSGELCSPLRVKKTGCAPPRKAASRPHSSVASVPRRPR
jgi:hypothetical protein